MSDSLYKETAEGAAMKVAIVEGSSDGGAGGAVGPGTAAAAARTTLASDSPGLPNLAAIGLESNAAASSASGPSTAISLIKGLFARLILVHATVEAMLPNTGSIGITTDAAATSDAGQFTLIALVKRLLVRISNIHAVQCTGAWAGNTGNNAAASGTIPAPGPGLATYIKGYTVSYSAAISQPRNLTISDSSGNIVDVDFVTPGPGPVQVEELAAANTAVTFNLPASGTAGVIGRIRIYYTTLAVI